MIVDIEKILDEFKLNLSQKEKKHQYEEIKALIESKLAVDNISFIGNPKVIDAAYLPKDRNLFQKILNKYIENCDMNGDFSNYFFHGVKMEYVRFSAESKLPVNKKFFKDLCDSTLVGCTLPKMDMSGYNLDGVLFDEVIFHPDTIIPDDSNFFHLKKNGEQRFKNCALPKIDLSKYELDYQRVYGLKFAEGTTLSPYKNYFVYITNTGAANSKGSVCRIELPTADYSKYEFKNAIMSGLAFKEGSILPISNDLFQNIKDKKLYATVLPDNDFSSVDFTGVKLFGTKFHPNAKLPTNKDLFQSIFNKRLSDCILPNADYSQYDFSDVILSDTIFAESSILPLDIFEQISTKSNLFNCKFPMQLIKERVLHSLPVNNPDGMFNLNLRRYDIPEGLLKLLHAKYKNTDAILLPSLESERKITHSFKYKGIYNEKNSAYDSIYSNLTLGKRYETDKVDIVRGIGDGQELVFLNIIDDKGRDFLCNRKYFE